MFLDMELLSIHRLCIVLLMLSVSIVSGQEDGIVKRRQLVPAMFIFGDSLIDNGNNNNLMSLARANYFPYGIDFKGGATGRFSNGNTIVDTIAEFLGLPPIPAYSEASGDQMRYGVNYASAAAGILDDTGRNFVSRTAFNQQIKNFENTLEQITDHLSAPDTVQVLAKSIFYVGMGSNDYLNNYLLPNYNTSNQYNAEQYSDLLVHQYSHQLSRLYDLGARKFVIGGLGLMGCIPNVRARGNNNGGCSEEINQLVLPFNTKTKATIEMLRADLLGTRFSYIDIRNMMEDLMANARSYGFSVVDRGCCGVGRNRGEITCLPFQVPCLNRNQYVFWDAFHPTEAVNVLLGRKAFDGNLNFVHPMNIEQLASL